MKKDWTIVIRRWDNEKLKHVAERRQVTEIELDYDAEDGEKITSVYVYTAMRRICIYTVPAVQS